MAWITPPTFSFLLSPLERRVIGSSLDFLDAYGIKARVPFLRGNKDTVFEMNICVDKFTKSDACTKDLEALLRTHLRVMHGVDVDLRLSGLRTAEVVDGEVPDNG